MRWSMIVFLVAMASVAHADTPEQAVRALVTRHVTALGARDPRRIAKDFTADAKVVIGNSDPEPAPGSAVFDVSDQPFPYTIKSLTVGVDAVHHVGWFHVLYDGTAPPSGMQPEVKIAVRANGIVVDDKGWKLAFIVYTTPVEDRDLQLQSPQDPRYAEALRIFDDQRLGLQVAKWFTDGGLARDVAALAVVSGSASGEYAAGPGVRKYIDAWSKIAFGVSQIISMTWGEGTIGFVRVRATMPWKKGQTELRLGAVVVRDGASWKWVSLQWSAR